MTIRILPSDLSSQISAGEIIDRPSSVVKEIIENSIDSGASDINIAVEKSGLQSIIITDNGCGINKKELLLAISRHATSKINVLSDLEKISTFGFRGEALASIRAVSRLTVISSTCYSSIAWKLYSEGYDDNNNVFLRPVAHPQGTTIIVENLFYNIPVRLKFLKNKKLELLKVHEVIKKIALSHFHINFSFKYNDKIIIKYNSIKNTKNKIYRLNNILNITDCDNLLEIKTKNYNIELFGWILPPTFFKKSKKIQYCYINNRYVYNNIIINAMSSAYQEIVGNKNVAFILYVKIPCNEIDINIHPTKNEIKFHQSNVIYTLIYKSALHVLKKLQINFVLKNSILNNNLKRYNNVNTNSLYFLKFNDTELKLSDIFKKNKILFTGKCTHSIKKNYKHITFNNQFKKDHYSFGKLLIITHRCYGVLYYLNNFSLISFPVAQKIVSSYELQNTIQQKIIPKSVPVNIKINIHSEVYTVLLDTKEILTYIGLNLIFKNKYVVLTSIPYFLKKQNINILISKFFMFLLFKKHASILEIVNWFYINTLIEVKDWDYTDGISLLLKMEYFCPFLFKNPPLKLLQNINIDKALCMLKI